MCLINNPKDLASFLKNKARNKTGNIIVWKVILKDEEGYNSSIFNHKWKNGLNISNTKRKRTSTKTEKINRGFHVYLSKQEAMDQFWDGSYKYLLLKCVANIKDLIALNFYNQFTKQAVFSKLVVHLPK